MFARWRYRGRHRGGRGCFPDYYRSVQAFTAAQQTTAKLIQLIDRDIALQLSDACRRQLESYVTREEVWAPLGGNTPTLILDTKPHDRSGYHPDIAALVATLWLPGDDIDDDEHAVLDRLMAIEGA